MSFSCERVKIHAGIKAARPAIPGCVALDINGPESAGRSVSSDPADRRPAASGFAISDSGHSAEPVGQWSAGRPSGAGRPSDPDSDRCHWDWSDSDLSDSDGADSEPWRCPLGGYRRSADAEESQTPCQSHGIHFRASKCTRGSKRSNVFPAIFSVDRMQAEDASAVSSVMGSADWTGAVLAFLQCLLQSARLFLGVQFALNPRWLAVDDTRKVSYLASSPQGRRLNSGWRSCAQYRQDRKEHPSVAGSLRRVAASGHIRQRQFHAMESGLSRSDRRMRASHRRLH